MSTPQAFIDTETTGLGPRDQIVELAIVQSDGIRVPGTWRTLIRPTIPIPVNVSDIHGITPAMVMNSPDFKGVVDIIDELLRGRILIAHNAKFDVRMLRQEYKRIGRCLGDTFRNTFARGLWRNV